MSNITQKELVQIYSDNPEFGIKFKALNTAVKEYESTSKLLLPLEAKVFDSFGITSFDDLYDENTYELKDSDLQQNVIDDMHQMYISNGFNVIKGVSPILKAENNVRDIVHDLIKLHENFVDPSYGKVLHNVKHYNSFKNLCIAIAKQVVKNTTKPSNKPDRTKPQSGLDKTQFQAFNEAEFNRITGLIESSNLPLINPDNRKEIATYMVEFDRQVIITKTLNMSNNTIRFNVEIDDSGHSFETSFTDLNILMGYLSTEIESQKESDFNSFMKFFEPNNMSLFNDILDVINGDELDFMLLGKPLKVESMVVISPKTDIYFNKFALEFKYEMDSKSLFASIIMGGEFIELFEVKNSLKHTFNEADRIINDIKNASELVEFDKNMIKTEYGTFEGDFDYLLSLDKDAQIRYTKRLGELNKSLRNKPKQQKSIIYYDKTYSDFVATLNKGYNDIEKYRMYIDAVESHLNKGWSLTETVDKSYNHIKDKLNNFNKNNQKYKQQKQQQSHQPKPISDKEHIRKINALVKSIDTNFRKGRELEKQIERNEVFGSKRDKLIERMDNFAKKEQEKTKELEQYIQEHSISEDLWFETIANEYGWYYEDFIDNE